MTPRVIVRRLVAAFLALGLLAAVPASAEVEKFMKHCDGKLCAFFRASVQIPDGWVEDKEATDYFNAVMLLPKGLEFEKAPAKIYAIARYNHDKQPISDFLPDTIRELQSRAKDAKITALADLPRAGKPPFIRHAFEAPSLPEQGYELRSVTTDNDGGSQFIVTIVLSANSKAALKAAEPAYLAILHKY
jgi:hypothetical protein